MDFAESIKDFYYSLEDKYYGLLDWIEAKGLPVYKLIDPIDEVIPSFALFSLVILVLALGLVWILFFTSQQYSITVKVIELANGNPVSGVSVDYNYWLEGSNEKKAGSSRTLTNGTFTVEKLSGTLYFDFSIKKTGFLNYKSTAPQKITANTTAIILKLEKQAPVPTIGKTIVVRDASRTVPVPIEDSSINASFSCSTGKQVASKTRQSSPITVSTQELNACGTITATIESLGFIAQSRPLSSEPTIFDLLKDAPTKGFLKVFVKDQVTNAALKNIDLTVYSEDSTPLSTGITDEAGSKIFEQNPGTYFVKANESSSPDLNYNSGTSVLIAVTAGQTAETTILLQRAIPSEEKNLKIQVLDSNDSAPIPGALVFYSIGGVLAASPVTTDTEGKAVIEHARNGVQYFVRVSSAGFVSYYGQVFPKDPSDSNYTKIMLSRIDESPKNYASIMVSVKNEFGSIVPEATVKLYNTAFLSVPIISQTNSGGLADFSSEKLPAGQYIAFAKKTYSESGQTIDANGLDGPKTVALGQSIDFNITLMLALAHLKVKVIGENGIAIGGVDVNFFESEGADSFSSAPKFSATTGTTGFTTPAVLKTGKKVKIIASKPNYLATVRIVDNLSESPNPMIVSVVLVQESAFADFSIGLREELFNEGCTDNAPKPSRIEPGLEKTYGFIFNVIIPNASSQGNVKAHVRTDLDSLTNASSLRIDVKSALPSNYSPVISADYNRFDAFSDQNIISAFGKQANLSLGSLSAGVYSFCANLRVKSLAENTRLEIHYNAKSSALTLAERTKELIVGQLFCTDCPKFQYYFSICKAEGSDCGQNPRISLPSKSSAPFDLNYNQDYYLFYKVANTSGQKLSQSIDANFSTNDSALNFYRGGSFVESFIENIAPAGLAKDTITGEYSVLFKQVLKTTSKLSMTLLPLDATMPDANTFINFKANASSYSVSVPSLLYASNPGQAFNVIVSNAQTGARVSEAPVKVKVSDQSLTAFGDIDPNMPQPSTDSSGSASITLAQGYPAGKFLVLQVSGMAGFEDSAVYSIPFSNVSSLEAEELACVKFVEIQNPCSFDNNKMCLNSKARATGSFKIKNDNCASKIWVKLVGNYSSGSENVSLNVSSPNVWIPLEIGASTTAPITVSVNGTTPAGIIGQFPIYPEVKYEVAGNIKRGKEFTVFIEAPEYSSACLALGKTEFDVSTKPEDKNAADNYCYIQHSDPNVPSLAISEEPRLFALMESSNSSDQSPVSFNWRIKADALEFVKNQIAKYSLGMYYFSVSAEALTDDGTFEADVTTPKAGDQYAAISDKVKQVNKIRIGSFISGNDENIAVVTDPGIKINFTNGSPEKTINCITATRPNPPGPQLNYCAITLETHSACPRAIDRDCNYGYFDLDVSGLSELDRNSISSITLKVLNPKSDSFVFLDISGIIVENSFDSNRHYFTGSSPEHSAQVIPGRETQIDLGIMPYGIDDLKTAQDYKGGTIIDANFRIMSNDPKVDAWISLDLSDSQLHAYASYYGSAKNLEIIGGKQRSPLTIFNNSWAGEGYSVLTMTDYLDQVAKQVREG